VADSVGDFVLRRLRDWGVEQVFAYPGDGINGLVAAFGAAGDRPRFVQSRHEEMSALQAVGYAKFSGQVGVCMATSGPGAIHLLNGLYDAKLDHVPVVAIVGQTERSAMGGSYQQEVDLQALLKDVASDYLVEVNVAEQLPNAVDRAFRTALTHVAINSAVVVLFLVSLVLRSAVGTDRSSTAAVGLSIVALALLGVSGWLGGRLAYTFGVRVAGEETQADAYR